MQLSVEGQQPMVGLAYGHSVYARSAPRNHPYGPEPDDPLCLRDAGDAALIGSCRGFRASAARLAFER